MKTRERRNSERSAPSRNIWIGSHRTSVRLEPVMWAALNDIAVERGKTVHDVILEINRDRKGISLTAAIRVYIVEYYREALRCCREEKAPPSPAGGNLNFGREIIEDLRPDPRRASLARQAPPELSPMSLSHRCSAPVRAPP
jgi:predicted DNA-binding ribbon-helix-helix protein